ncbi:MAG TPA: hypothetical protein VGV87_24800 [Blastocatellia bacterium]|jgi:hypothetical protein|nr:hypothetical protein [Blastocatellia bacterium]
MDDKHCLPADLSHFPWNVWGLALQRAREAGVVRDPACYDGQWGGFEYIFNVTPSDVGGRLKRPYGVECEINDRGACEWNEPHPLIYLSESPSSVRFIKSFGSRSVTVRGWATEEIWDSREATRSPSWDLQYDGFPFTFTVDGALQERIKAFSVEWADHSSEPISLDGSGSRIKCSRLDASGNSFSYKCQVTMGESAPAALKQISSSNLRLLQGR